MNLKIVTWNVNSIKARLPNVLEFLNEQKPDVVLFQELKCQEQDFPTEAIEELGYNLAISGQKTYNGVAIISRYKIDDVVKILEGDPDDDEARYIEGVINLPNSAIRIASIYVPNGQEPYSEKFAYKLHFFERLREHLTKCFKYDEVQVFGGDYNVAPENIDVYDPATLHGTTCFHPEERRMWRSLINCGYADAFRALYPDEQQFSWWDYRAGSWQKNHGLRIDHFLTSPTASDKITSCKIMKDYRGKEKASDHAPVMLEIKV